MKLIQVGLGLWGLNWAQEVIPSVPGVELVAHVDASPQAASRAEQAGILSNKIYNDLDSALASVRADAVLATVPLAAHAGLCRQALARGLHVLVEKPFTEDLGEARALMYEAEKAGLILAVNQNYRYFPHALAARDLVRSAAIGRPQAMRVTFTRMYDENYRYFFLEQPLLSDMAIHHFDLMRFVLNDEPVVVNCRAWSEPGLPFDGPPAASALIRFAKGTIVQYFGSWIARGVNSPYGGQWELDGTLGQAKWQFRGDKNARHAQDRFLATRIDQSSAGPVLPELSLIDRAGVLAAFTKRVDQGIDDKILSVAADNIKSLALMDAAIRSARSDGSSVEIQA